MDSGAEIEISLSPTPAHMAQLVSFLRAEWRRHDSGFYCNIRVIRAAYRSGELIVALRDGRAVGLLVWCNMFPGRGVISIMTVKRPLRRQGIGQVLVRTVLGHLKARGVWRVGCQCAPASSEPYWRSHGFIDDPDQSHRASGEIRLVKLIGSVPST